MSYRSESSEMFAALLAEELCWRDWLGECSTYR
jgi:hypothetical protein